jgi:hypothetical protein
MVDPGRKPFTSEDQPMNRPRLLSLCLTAAVFVFTCGGAARAENPTCAGFSVGELKKMCVEELEQLFAAGQVGTLPVGLGRGKILVRLDGKMPHVRARMEGVVWKGKYFYPDGHFTNQWLGFKAVSAEAVIGPSWYDGKPCIVLDYPPDAKVFGNARDELREIAPGVFLCRFYERCPCPKLQGYFVLRFDCACGCR